MKFCVDTFLVFDTGTPYYRDALSFNLRIMRMQVSTEGIQYEVNSKLIETRFDGMKSAF